MDADRVTILLKEYEMLHSDSNALGTRFWTFMTMITALMTALLGGAGFIITNSFSQRNCGQQITSLVMVLILSLAMIIINIFSIYWRKYTNAVQEFNYVRAREIEHELGMEKNLRFSYRKQYATKDNNKKPEGCNWPKVSQKYEECKCPKPDWYWPCINKRVRFNSKQGDYYVSAIFYAFVGLWAVAALLSAALLLSIALNFRWITCCVN